MQSRRNFLIMAVGSGVVGAITVPALARAKAARAKGATAITQVFGDGARFTAVAVEYDEPVKASKLSPGSFNVAGRTVTSVFASISADPAERAPEGKFVIVMLSPEDENAGLARKVATQGSGGGPGKAGDIPTYDTTWPPASATVAQSRGSAVATTQVKNLIVDDFGQFEFDDPATGKLLRYNLFVPKPYDPGRTYEDTGKGSVLWSLDSNDRHALTLGRVTHHREQNNLAHTAQTIEDARACCARRANPVECDRVALKQRIASRQLRRPSADARRERVASRIHSEVMLVYRFSVNLITSL